MSNESAVDTVDDENIDSPAASPINQFLLQASGILVVFLFFLALLAGSRISINKPNGAALSSITDYASICKKEISKSFNPDSGVVLTVISDESLVEEMQNHKVVVESATSYDNSSSNSQFECVINKNGSILGFGEV